MRLIWQTLSAESAPNLAVAAEALVWQLEQQPNMANAGPARSDNACKILMWLGRLPACVPGQS